MLTQPILYIALLGPRDEPQFTNVPQPSVCSPMLRFLGYFPQSMYHFIYGVEYYEQVKRHGLQMGYDVKFVYPDFLIIDCHCGVDENTHQSFLMMGYDCVSGEDIIANDIHPRLVFLSACKTFTAYNTVSTIANAFFQTGAASVITSYMSLDVMPSTMLYCRLLNNLSHAARNPVHFNWLSFMSHLLRTSYIDAPLEQAVGKKGMPSKEQLMNLLNLQTEGMRFSKRREIYNNLNTNSFTKSLGVDYKYVIPHYLMYSILGRADLVRFEVMMEKACEVSLKDVSKIQQKQNVQKYER